MSDGKDETIRIISIVFSFFHLLTFGIFLSISVIDLIYYFTVSTGYSAFILYSVAWWCILIFVIINYILPMALLTATSSTGAEFHFVFSNVTVVLNFIAFVLCIVCYLLFINTSFSGGFPFNDPKWCCVYYLDHPELCPNTDFCPGDPVTLYANAQFIIIWIFTGVFFILGLIHLAINQLIQKSGMIPPPTREEAINMGLIVSFAYLAIFAYWAAFPLLDTIFINGYPTLGVPPGPGEFVSLRYNYWQWWFVFFLITNIGPPMIYIASISMKPSLLTTSTHFWGSLFTGIFASASFFVFLGILIFDCNYSWSGGSICNSHLWCCNYFSSYWEICGNVTPCTVNLYPSSEFIQHLVISLVMAFFAYLMIWLNERMVRYGVFK